MLRANLPASFPQPLRASVTLSKPSASESSNHDIHACSARVDGRRIWLPEYMRALRLLLDDESEVHVEAINSRYLGLALRYGRKGCSKHLYK